MRRGIPAFILLLLIAGCQAGSRMASPQTLAAGVEAEALIGRQAAPSLEQRFGGTVAHAALTQRAEHIELRLARANPDLRGEWQFRLLASDKVNAFSLPGRLIYATRGLCERRLGDDSDLLAAVIAHEMAHVIRKDSLKPACTSSSEALAREISADRLAASYLKAAGYDPRHLSDLLRLIDDVQPESWAESRVAALAS